MTRSLLRASPKPAGSGWQPVSERRAAPSALPPCPVVQQLSGPNVKHREQCAARPSPRARPPRRARATAAFAQKQRLWQTLPLLQIDYRECACRVALGNCMCATSAAVP